MSGAVGKALARALRTSVNFVNFRGSVDVEPLASTLWASVTFAGARHRLRLTIEGPGAVGRAADLLARLPELELAVPGQLVADLVLLAEERRDGGAYAALELEALTIEER